MAFSSIDIAKKRKKVKMILDKLFGREIRYVDIDKIRPDPNQPRKTFDAEKLKESAESFKHHGTIVPIEIDENNKIIVGELRWRQAKLAGLKKIPIRLVKGLTPEQRLERQLVENINRQNLEVNEVIPKLKLLLKHYKNENKKKGKKYNACKEQKELAKRLGISESWLSKLIDLDKAPKEIKDAVKKKEISVNTAVEIRTLNSEKDQANLVKKAKNMRKSNLREVIRIIRKTPKEIKDAVLEEDLELKDAEKLLEIQDKEIQKLAFERIKEFKKQKESIFKKMKKIEKSRDQMKNRQMINILNELKGDEWLKFTRSWYIFDALDSDLEEEKAIAIDSEEHPATFSPTMIADFVRFFTKRKEVVLDPFVGIGSTLVACMRSGRKGIGIDINKKFIEVTKKRLKEAPNQKLIHGDAWNIKKYNLPKINYSITSPPYFEMLKKIDVTQKRRLVKGLPTDYKNKNVLGRDVNEYVKKLVDLYSKIHRLMKANSYITIILQNFREKKIMLPLAWKFAIAMQDSGKWDFKGEKIWCQAHKKLHPFGFPRDWVSNVHHHYCLIFKRMNE